MVYNLWFLRTYANSSSHYAVFVALFVYLQIIPTHKILRH